MTALVIPLVQSIDVIIGLRLGAISRVLHSMQLVWIVEI